MTAGTDHTAHEHTLAGWQAHLALTAITAYLAVLFLLPARLVVPALGAAGRPAVILGCLLLAAYVVGVLTPGTLRARATRTRVLLVGYGLIFLLIYGLGTARGLAGVEQRATDRSLIVMASLLGVALLVADGLRSWAEIRMLLRRLVVLGSVLALIGAVQFFLGVNLVERIRVPGLSLNREVLGIGERGGPGFARVAGTANHYIEYGVVLAMLVPIAIHIFLFWPPGRSRVLPGVGVGLLAACVPLSVSRAGTLALVVGLVLLGLSWRPQLQRRAAVVTVVGVLVFQAVIPGLLGTIRSAFVNYENDPSIQNRRSDYGTVMQYVSERPWFGRGPGTFIPDRYLVLDNQALMSVLEGGLVGALALLLLLVLSMCSARNLRHRASFEEGRHLGQVLFVVIVQALVASLTFDSLSFATFAGLLFVALGLVGAAVRLAGSSTGTHASAVVLRATTMVPTTRTARAR